MSEATKVDAATPRPWKIQNGGFVVSSDGTELIADILQMMGSGKANAALIVRAVNSHDALVRAIESALSIVDLWLPASVEKEHEIEAAALDHMHLRLRAALSAAKGEE